MYTQYPYPYDTTNSVQPGAHQFLINITLDNPQAHAPVTEKDIEHVSKLFDKTLASTTFDTSTPFSTFIATVLKAFVTQLELDYSKISIQIKKDKLHITAPDFEYSLQLTHFPTQYTVYQTLDQFFVAHRCGTPVIRNKILDLLNEYYNKPDKDQEQFKKLLDLNINGFLQSHGHLFNNKSRPMSYTLRDMYGLERFYENEQVFDYVVQFISKYFIKHKINSVITKKKTDYLAFTITSTKE